MANSEIPIITKAEAKIIDELIGDLRRRGFSKFLKGRVSTFRREIWRLESLLKVPKRLSHLAEILAYLNTFSTTQTPPTIKDIAQYLPLHYAVTLSILRQFEKMGLLEFVRHPSSASVRRVFGLKIKPEGQRVLRILEEAYRAYQNA